MGPREEIARRVRLLEGGVITSGEFFSQVMNHLWKLPSREQHAVLNALANHANDRVRKEALDLQVFVRHQELSKDFNYVQAHSPLRPGARLALFGGYDYYASHGHPRWLNGCEYYTATFLRFARRGDDEIPIALVEFDDRIDMPGHTGRYGILIGTYGSHSFAWGLPEDGCAVHVVDVLPDDLAAFFSVRPPETALESHATYRVVTTNATPEPSGS